MFRFTSESGRFWECLLRADVDTYMGIVNKIKSLFSADEPLMSGARKAAAGRSDLTDAATKLDEMRGDAVPAGNDPAHRPQDDKIAAIVASANATKNAELSTGGKVVETMTDHGVK